MRRLIFQCALKSWFMMIWEGDALWMARTHCQMASKTDFSAYVLCKDTSNDVSIWWNNISSFCFSFLRKRSFIVHVVSIVDQNDWDFLCLPTCGQVICSELCKAAARYDFKNSLLKINLCVINGTSVSKIHVVFLLPEIFQVTSAASDPGLSFTIISCFISPNSNPAVASDYTLIEMVCPKDDSVKFYPQRDVPFSRAHVEKKRFAFKFNSKFNLSLLFLHCEMSLCSKMSQTDSKLPPVGSVILLFFFMLMNIITLRFHVS